MTSGVIFALAVNEFISYIRCRQETYMGPVKGSDYLINGYPQHSTIQGLLFAIFLMFLICKFSACIYTRIIVSVFLFIQSFNMAALIFQFGFNVYDVIVYPIFLFTILTLGFIKFLRWGSQKHS